jgi:hypothetical protein
MPFKRHPAMMPNLIPTRAPMRTAGYISPVDADRSVGIARQRQSRPSPIVVT